MGAVILQTADYNLLIHLQLSQGKKCTISRHNETVFYSTKETWYLWSPVAENVKATKPRIKELQFWI